MMRATTMIFVLGMLLGCGGTTPEPQSGGNGGGDAGESCAGHRATDACMNDDNFAACQQREAECPGAVLVLESCPLQFRCP